MDVRFDVEGADKAVLHELVIDFNERDNTILVGGFADREPIGGDKDTLVLSVTAQGTDTEGNAVDETIFYYTVAVAATSQDNQPVTATEKNLFDGVTPALLVEGATATLTLDDGTIAFDEKQEIDLSDDLGTQFNDPDGDRLTYTYKWVNQRGTEIEAPDGLSVEIVREGGKDVLRLKGTPDVQGPVTTAMLAVEASDGFPRAEGSTASVKTFTLSIVGNSEIPKVTETAFSLAAAEGEPVAQEFDLNDFFVDPDSPLSFELSADNLDNTGLDIRIIGSKLIIDGTPTERNENFTANFTINAFDESERPIPREFSFTITANDDAPTLSQGAVLNLLAIGAGTSDPATLPQVDLDEYFTDSDSALTYMLSIGSSDVVQGLSFAVDGRALGDGGAHARTRKRRIHHHRQRRHK